MQSVNSIKTPRCLSVGDDEGMAKGCVSYVHNVPNVPVEVFWVRRKALYSIHFNPVFCNEPNVYEKS